MKLEALASNDAAKLVVFAGLGLSNVNCWFSIALEASSKIVRLELRESLNKGSVGLTVREPSEFRAVCVLAWAMSTGFPAWI